MYVHSRVKTSSGGNNRTLYHIVNHIGYHILRCGTTKNLHKNFFLSRNGIGIIVVKLLGGDVIIELNNCNA
jgi:hypothetical protein